MLGHVHEMVSTRKLIGFMTKVLDLLTKLTAERKMTEHPNFIVMCKLVHKPLLTKFIY